MSNDETLTSTSKPWFERFLSERLPMQALGKTELKASDFDYWRTLGYPGQNLQVVDDGSVGRSEMYWVSPAGLNTYGDLDNAYKQAMYGGGTLLPTPVPPRPDHRYDRILEEFGGKSVKPTPVPYTSQPAIWTPPSGAFPEPDPETVLEFPKYEQRVGRWLCSVVVKVSQEDKKSSGEVFFSYSIRPTHRYWLKAESADGEPLPVYQKWAVMDNISPEGIAGKLISEFEKWVLEIEANPECCVKHKLIGKYDGSVCVGTRSEQPPVGLAPEEEKAENLYASYLGYSGYAGLPLAGVYDKMASSIFDTSPIFTKLSKGETAGQFSGGSNIAVSNPKTAYKIHGIK